MFKRNDLDNATKLMPADFDGLAMEYFAGEGEDFESMEQFEDDVQAGRVTLWSEFQGMATDDVVPHCQDFANMLHDVYLVGVQAGRAMRVPASPAPPLTFVFVTDCDGCVEVTRVHGVRDYDEAVAKLEASSDQPFTSIKIISVMIVEGMPPMRLRGEMNDL